MFFSFVHLTVDYSFNHVQYGPNLDVEGKRIFVFNRRILTDNAKEPQRIRLQPFDITKPDLSVGELHTALLFVLSLILL